MIRLLRVSSVGLRIGLVFTSAALVAGAGLFAMLQQVISAPPVGVEDAASLFHVVRHDVHLGTRSSRLPFTLREVESLLNAPRPIRSVAAYTRVSALMTIADVAHQANILVVTPGYFGTLGSRVVAGSVLTEAQGVGSRSMVVSHAFFRTILAPLGRGLGDLVRVNGLAFTIVGVAKPGFSGVDMELVTAWVPHGSGIVPPLPGRVSSRWSMVLRLHSPSELPQALARVRTVLSENRQAAALYETNQPVRLVSAVPGKDHGDPRLSQLMRWLSVTCLALAAIAMVNILFLSFVHALGHELRLAISHALGARISLLLARKIAAYTLLFLVGGTTGFVILAFLRAPLAAFLSLGPEQLQLSRNNQIGTVAGLVAMLGIAIAPWSLTLRRLTREIVTVLRGHTASAVSRSRHAFLSVQVMVASALVLVAVHFWTAVQQLQAIQLQFEPQTMWVATIAANDPEKLAGAVDWRSRILRHPGVLEVAFATLIPTEGSMSMPVELPGTSHTSMLYSNSVDERYFRALGLQLLQGRGITSEDHASAPLVAVVNQTLENTLLKAGIPFGQQCLGPASAPCAIRVVGVVEDSKYLDLLQAPIPFAYTALAQRASGAPIVAHVRMRSPGSTVPDFTLGTRDLVATGQRFRSFSEVFAARLRPWTVGLILFSSLAFLGLVVAVAGLISVVWSIALSRVREFAIRSALGATSAMIRTLILAQVAKWVAPSIVCGLLLGEILTAAVGNTAPWLSPRTTTSVGLILMAACLIAAVIPAWRLSASPELARKLATD